MSDDQHDEQTSRHRWWGLSISSLVEHPRGAVIAIFVASLLWGSAFPAIKGGYAMLGLDPSGDVLAALSFAGIRFLIAGLVLLFGGAILGLGVKVGGRAAVSLAALGLVQTTLQYTTFYLGMVYTTGVKASIIMSSGSFFLALLSPLFYREDRLSRWAVFGLLVGFSGVVVANLARPGTELRVQLLGDGLILASGLCSAVASLMSKRMVQRIHPVVVNGYQLILGSTVLLALSAPAAGWLFRGITPELAGLTLYLAAVTAIAFSLYYLVVKHHDLTKVAAYRFLIPLSGVWLSALLIPGESLGWRQLVAAILVALGVWSVNQRAVEREKNRN